MGKFFRSEECLTYDDVLLVPQFSEIKSRKDVDISVDISNEYTGKKIKLQTPVISAPMDTVTSQRMAEALSDFGSMGVIHRFCSIDDRINMAKQMAHEPYVSQAICIAVGQADPLDKVLELSQWCDFLCFDVAHCDNSHALDYLGNLIDNENFDIGCQVIAGNIATGAAAVNLAEVGVEIIKVGIGGGSCCSTRIVTGHGYPNLSAILEVKEALTNYHTDGNTTKIIADGGIRNSGDVAKALAAGADLVMVGSLFAGTDEAPGKLREDGTKEFRGMASYTAQSEWLGYDVAISKAAEGVSTFVKAKGPVRKVLDELNGGLRSALSYTGANDLYEFYLLSQFIKVTPNSVVENHPHILKGK